MDKHIKTGRTHLMDAMPLRLSQEMGGWATQMRKGINRLHAAEKKHVDVGTRRHRRRHRHQHRPPLCRIICPPTQKSDGAPFIPNSSFFESLSAQDAAVEMSGQLKNRRRQLDENLQRLALDEQRPAFRTWRNRTTGVTAG